MDAINALAAQLRVPPTVNGSFQGTAQAFQASLSSMPLLVAAAILVVYIVLGILYESYIHPITILSALPSAGVGALVMLMLCGYDLSVIAIIGIILLIGIVKKNAIMMIDFALQAERIDGKSPREAIHEACLLRFRPIMMTTFAALFGSLPIALGHGAGSELRRPLGIAIIGGLLVSQWLTLYTTPVIYLYLERFSRWLGRSHRPSRVADVLSRRRSHGATRTGPTRCGMSDMQPVVEDPATGRTFGFLVQDVARLLKRHFERRARQSGLPITRRQAAVMIYVARHEGVSQAEVAARLDHRADLAGALARQAVRGRDGGAACPSDRPAGAHLVADGGCAAGAGEHSADQPGDPRGGICRPGRARRATR